MSVWCRASMMAAAVILAPVLAHAAPIIICNTGQAAGCVGTLPDLSLDPNYTIIEAPAGFTGASRVVLDDAFPIPPWAPNDANSKWIGPATASNLDSDGDEGRYVYRTTFDLTGLDADTAVLTGRWGTDNTGVDILINGISTGYTRPFDAFGALATFSITSGFVDGINTLDFVLLNVPGPANNPTGLRVDDLVGSAQPIPEPGTLALLASGLGGAIAQWRRRRREVRP